MHNKSQITLLAAFLIFLSSNFMGIAYANNHCYELNNANSSDTTYSGQINIQSSILTFPLPNATVKFSIIDSINQTTNLVYEGITNEDGALVVDSLPIVSNYVGIENLNEQIRKDNQVIISHNGTGSNHSILLKSNQEFSKQGFIVDLNGRMVDAINLSYNPLLMAYEGYWNGAAHKTGTYIFYAKTKRGTFAEKISHISNYSGIKSQIQHSAKQFPILKTQLKQTHAVNSKYKVDITSEVAEPFSKFIYVEEKTAADFSFLITHLPIPNAKVEGYVTENDSTRISGAVISWVNLSSGNSFELTTDTNGYFRKEDITVPIDNQFTNPEKTRFYINVNVGDSLSFKIDPITVVSGEISYEIFNNNSALFLRK